MTASESFDAWTDVVDSKHHHAFRKVLNGEDLDPSADADFIRQLELDPAYRRALEAALEDGAPALFRDGGNGLLGKLIWTSAVAAVLVVGLVSAYQLSFREQAGRLAADLSTEKELRISEQKLRASSQAAFAASVSEKESLAQSLSAQREAFGKIQQSHAERDRRLAEVLQALDLKEKKVEELTAKADQVGVLEKKIVELEGQLADSDRKASRMHDSLLTSVQVFSLSELRLARQPLAESVGVTLKVRPATYAAALRSEAIGDSKGYQLALDQIGDSSWSEIAKVEREPSAARMAAMLTEIHLKIQEAPGQPDYVALLLAQRHALLSIASNHRATDLSKDLTHLLKKAAAERQQPLATSACLLLAEVGPMPNEELSALLRDLQRHKDPALAGAATYASRKIFVSMR